MSDKEIVDITIPPQSSINLKKMSSGYGWEIKVYDDDLDSGFDKIVALDKKLRDKFCIDES